MLQGQLIVVAAPSGAGKTSLVRAVAQKMPNVVVSVSHTTREAREGELDGVHYHFIAKAKFETMIQDRLLLEHAVVHGEFYGTSKAFVQRHLLSGQDVVLEIDYQGAALIKQQFPDVVMVFVFPPSMQALDDRLRGRGQDTDDVIKARLTAARNEMQHADAFDYWIINDDFDYATMALCHVVQASHFRQVVQKKSNEALIGGLMAV